MGTLTDSGANSAQPLREIIDLYNDAWNAQDVDAIVSMHAPDMVFENHTAGERAEGASVRDHIASIFAGWPDLRFESVRLYVSDGLIVQEWLARATHTKTITRGSIEAPASGRELTWAGVDVIPTEGGKIKRKDVYSDSVAILRQVGLLD